MLLFTYLENYASTFQAIFKKHLFVFISIWKYKIFAVLRTLVYTILVLLRWRDLVLRITLIKTFKILKISIFKNISHIHFPINKISMFTTLTVILLIKILKKLVVDLNGRIQIDINNICVLWCILCKLRWKDARTHKQICLKKWKNETLSILMGLWEKYECISKQTKIDIDKWKNAF